MRKLTILGSTGSIGESTLDVVARHPDKYQVIALAANRNIDLMIEQCQQFKPEVVVMVCQKAASKLTQALSRLHINNIKVLSGKQALIEVAEHDAVDTVMAAIVGASGMLPTLAAVNAGKRVLLANKEALVTSGQIFIDAMKKSNAEILPIDSEHNAIFQCLPQHGQENIGSCQLSEQGVSKILLTGSGGPFRTRAIDTLNTVTPEQACNHPNWDMGQKISVDSATMMNKGLEFIEAKWLFNVDADNIQVVLHPQSTIHSMVQYKDGSVLAQMGNPDMRTPIAHALAYPHRIDSGVQPLDFFTTASFEFQQADFNRYPNLKLAIEACKSGQAACTALNASNEVAVDAFLNHAIRFTDIYKVNQKSVDNFKHLTIGTIEQVISLDEDVREYARLVVNDLCALNEQDKKGA